MSPLWTPYGEHEPEGESPKGGAPTEPGGDFAERADEIDEEAAREELRNLRSQLAATPVADIIANHVIGLWELAVLHLSPEEGEVPDLEQAQLAIDAVAALVEGLGERLGRHEAPLRDALAQLRMAYVQIARRHEGGDATG